MNLCRLYKHITTLTDIMDHTGTQLRPDLWDPSVQHESYSGERFPTIVVPRKC